MKFFKKKIFESENAQHNESREVNIPKPFNEEDNLAKLDQQTPYNKIDDQNFFTTEATREVETPSFRSFQQHVEPQTQQIENTSKREIELILSKLDTIKANIETINQRVTHIENQLTQQEKIRKKI